MKKLKETDVSKLIAAFLEKYNGNPKQVEWPQWEFTVKSVPEAKIEESSLREFDKRWTFSGTAVIQKTDEKNTAQTTTTYKITGSALVDSYVNDYDQNDLLPDVKQVTITKIEL